MISQRDFSGTRNCHIKAVLGDKQDPYTTTFSSYKAWDTNVNLDSPDPNVPLTKDDDHIYDYYDALQYCLYETNLPETVDRTNIPRKYNSDTGVAIVVLSSPVECMAILLEGARQCPGDMLLVMSPTWLVKEKSETNPGLYSLYVKKAIVFDRGGSSFIDTFQEPRKCTYFLNYFTQYTTDGNRSDGEDIEANLDCPMSSSLEICKRIDDKVLTRILMVDSGIYYPTTLALAYKPAYDYKVPNDAGIKVLSFKDESELEENLSGELRRFLKSEYMENTEKVVVKPSGAIWHGSRGVSFHEVKDFDGIYNAVVELYASLDEGNAVLIEAFHQPAGSVIEELEGYSTRIRSTVCRTFDNKTVTTTIVCGTGPQQKPINGDNTIPQSYESTMEMFGIDETESNRIKKSVWTGSQRILDAIIKYEDGLPLDIRGGVRAQTDLIGVDFVLGHVNGKLEPICIEVNSHDCTINCHMFEFMNTDRQGESVGPYVETTIRRSQLFAMKGKHVLVVGAGGYSKGFIWDSFKSFGIKVILVDPDDENIASSKATYFIKYDYLDHINDNEHATEILKILNDMEIRIDGCVAFWEDCGPLAATISDRLGLYGPGQRAAEVAKKKSLTQSVLRSRTGEIPHFPKSYLYSAKAYPVENKDDIENAINIIGFPAVLKLEYGSSAVGVKPVSDLIQCRNMYHSIKSSLQTEEDHPGVGLGYGNDLFLMEFLEGTEHDVDVIIFQRKLIAAFVSDNGPTKHPKFTETASCMPTCLSSDRENMLVIAAYQCCTEIGLIDGVFNVEMKMTKTGPKLIEINARMGGFYLRDWIIACYGVDLLLYSFMCCLGIRPLIQKHKPKCHIMGAMCVPSAHKDQLKDLNKVKTELNERILNGCVRFNQIEASLEDCGPEDVEEPFCSIAVVESNRALAKDKLLHLFTEMGLHNKNYDMNYFLKDFNS